MGFANQKDETMIPFGDGVGGVVMSSNNLWFGKFIALLEVVLCTEVS